MASTSGHRSTWRAFALAPALGALALAAAPAVAGAQGSEVPSGQIPVSGEVAVHDPTLYKDGDTYIVAATHNSIRSAPSLEGPWTVHGDVPKADWTFDVSPGTLWAPHVQRVGDTFHYYYSQSSFGSQTSAIGLKTTQTPTDPSSYVDHGEPIIASGAVSDSDDPFDHNAIDPHLSQDADGDWWIAWGSHWDGIMIQRLENDMVTVTGQMKRIASRGFPPNRIEGPAIFERNGFYYLLTGWDQCCAGANSTYKISVGRSQSVDGPYVDKNGVPLTEGGGTTILDSRVARPGITPEGLWQAPGGPDVFVEDGTYYLVYHAYLPANTLGIRPLDWHDGWPYLQEPGGGPYDLSDGAYYRLTNEDDDDPVPSDRCLTAVEGDEPNVIQASCDDSDAQLWRLEREADGFHLLRTAAEGERRCLAISDASGEPGTNVVAGACDEATDLQRWYLDDAGHGFHRLVVEDANLALEVSDVDGTAGANVVGGSRRDAPIANEWPRQQWQLVAAEPPAPPPDGPRLRLVGRPRVKRVGPARKRVSFRARVTNRGDAPSGAVRLCAAAPPKRVRILGSRCVSRADVPIGATRRRAVRLRIKPAARGRLTRIRLIARGPSVRNRRAVTALRVRR